MQRKGRLYLLFISALLIAMTLSPDLAFCVHKQSSSFICSGCHTIHSSEDGTSTPTTPKAKLLRYSNDDLCYACHENGDGGVLHSKYSDAPVVKDALLTFDPNNLASIGAGGNFAYLDPNDADNGSTANQGYGHNFSDTGMYPAGAAGGTKVMHCATCHDPHGVTADSGTVDSYRNLKMSPDGDATYKNITNTAEGTTQNGNGVYPITGNKYGSTSSTDGSGISLWCEQCHTNFHGNKTSNLRHPVDISMNGANFTAYSASTYKLPLEDATGSTSANTNHSGNENTDRVFCLSCHFPHAGPYADALRWDSSKGMGSGEGCQQCHNK